MRQPGRNLEGRPIGTPHPLTLPSVTAKRIPVPSALRQTGQALSITPAFFSCTAISRKMLAPSSRPVLIPCLVSRCFHKVMYHRDESW